MKGSPRWLCVLAACAVSWTCSVYDSTFLLPSEVTAGGSTVAALGAGAPSTGGSTSTLAGAKSDSAGASAVVVGGNADNAGAATAGSSPTTSGSAPVAEAGASGAAGDAAVNCEDAPIPLKGSWKASASHSSLGVGDEYYNPPQNLMDLSPMRWSTGKPQAGDEWFQIDFGAVAAIRELSLTLNPDDADDFPRVYNIQISNEPLDFDGVVRASGAGANGQTLVVTLAEPVAGRYLLVQQKGKDPTSWWSVSELSARCF